MEATLQYCTEVRLGSLFPKVMMIVQQKQSG